jgi:hypothetical protein
MAFNIPMKPRVGATVPKPRSINPNGNRSDVLTPPRLPRLSVGRRDYAKGEQAAENPLAPGRTAGFGQTGLTGET